MFQKVIEMHIWTLFLEISKLARLEVFNLHDNKLQFVPLEIASLYSLQELYLGKNKLTSVPEQFGNLTKLQRFALDDNILTDIPGSLVRTSISHFPSWILSVDETWISFLRKQSFGVDTQAIVFLSQYKDRQPTVWSFFPILKQ